MNLPISFLFTGLNGTWQVRFTQLAAITRIPIRKEDVDAQPQ